MGQLANQTKALLRKDFLIKKRYPVAYCCTMFSQSLFILWVASLIRQFNLGDDPYIIPFVSQEQGATRQLQKTTLIISAHCKSGVS